MDKGPKITPPHLHARESWLFLESVSSATIRLDVRALDRILGDGNQLVLGQGPHTCFLTVVDGPDAARQLAEQLFPYTRSAQISERPIYEDAKRYLGALRDSTERPPTLFIGSEAAKPTGEYVCIGKSAFIVSEVQEYAFRGANIEIAADMKVEAAVVMIAVRASRRNDDAEVLSRRVADYEGRRSQGR